MHSSACSIELSMDVAILMPDYIQQQPNTHVSSYCHSMAFRQVHILKNFYKYSFIPLAIVQWNALPESVVFLPILVEFKEEIGKLPHSRL